MHLAVLTIKFPARVQCRTLLKRAYSGRLNHVHFPSGETCSYTDVFASALDPAAAMESRDAKLYDSTHIPRLLLGHVKSWQQAVTSGPVERG